jgi:hypothetical protein
MLYHYTSGGGLLGIVDSEALWATQAQYLNDGKELGLAYDIALSLLDEFESRNPSGTSALRTYLNNTRHSAHIFIGSFSEQGDELSQWRAYGRTGDSYSLGFDARALASAATQIGWRLVPCVYNRLYAVEPVCLLGPRLSYSAPRHSGKAAVMPLRWSCGIGALMRVCADVLGRLASTRALQDRAQQVSLSMPTEDGPFIAQAAPEGHYSLGSDIRIS